jgi:hypothetical protein
MPSELADVIRDLPETNLVPAKPAIDTVHQRREPPMPLAGLEKIRLVLDGGNEIEQSHADTQGSVRRTSGAEILRLAFRVERKGAAIWQANSVAEIRIHFGAKASRHSHSIADFLVGIPVERRVNDHVVDHRADITIKFFKQLLPGYGFRQGVRKTISNMNHPGAIADVLFCDRVFPAREVIKTFLEA